MNLSLLLFFMTYLIYVHCKSECTSHKSCGDCIRDASEHCMWCSQDIIKGERCQPVSSVSKGGWCRKEFIYKSEPKLHPMMDSPFSKTVQFRPQELNIKARPGVFVNFTMLYESAENFPLDVYFLMDYSFTMKKHSEALKNQAKQIFKDLKIITNDVRLGIGSFIEKPAFPIVDIVDEQFKKRNPPYVFKNHLKLTNNMSHFEEVINNVIGTFGTNHDDAEAGLDALMQVMTCESINWRNDTRRIIVLATDAPYHSAGDGKMIGAIKPNDMQCHLNDKGYYDEHISITHDYPSVGQINKVASDGHFKIIFAALSRVKDVYEALAKQILGSSYAELKDESNIISIIKTAYEESLRKVPITYNKYKSSNPSAVHVMIDQDCNGNPNTKNCYRSPKKKGIEIPASIKVTACSETGATNIHKIELFPVDLDEKLTVTFEVDCECECERNASKVESELCNKSGIMQCGACKCNMNRSGDMCQFNCSVATLENELSCFQDNQTVPCNGHGTCSCGKCECNKEAGRAGKFCEFHDGQCPQIDKKPCAGNGDCVRKNCICKPEWTGPDCTCPVKNDQCFGPLSSMACSGRGVCNCGQCVCEQGYLGGFCDFCENCVKERCKDLKHYAHCNIMESKNKCDEKFAINNTQHIDVYLQNKTDFNSIADTATTCKTKLDDRTFLLFKYQTISSTKLVLKIQNEVEQPEEGNIWIPIGSSIAGILLIGILTAIIWKILIDIYDKREYEKFCNEAKAQGYDVSQNPLYEPPTQNFVNPGFEQQQHTQ